MFPLAPVIVPVPVNGGQGCAVESAVPAPVIEPAPIRFAVPVPLAVIAAAPVSSLLDAWPE